MAKTVKISKDEYEDMVDYMEGMRETIEILSDKKAVKKLKEALKRVEYGEFLTKENMTF